MAYSVGSRLRRSLLIGGSLLLALSGTAGNSQSVTVQAGAGPIGPLYGNITPFYGNITPFYGNITPFYGNITPFYGNITPFWGNITPFWGNITPFTQSTDPTTIAQYGTNYDPFWGSGASNAYTAPMKPGIVYSQIGGFWTGLATSWSNIQSSWNTAQAPADYASIAAQLQTAIVNPSSSFWGKAIQSVPLPPPPPGTPATPKPATPLAATIALEAPIFAKAGITLNSDGSIDPNSLANVTPTQRAVLFLNLYDNLMSFSGTGHIDWWMGATGWSPALAATQGTVPDGGHPPTVGMLDFAVSTGTVTSKKITQYGSGVSNGHGAAVASLIVGTSDGSGVMSVMPSNTANVVVYNPYDSTGTTNWTDVGTGISTLANSIFGTKAAPNTTPVGVLNASLGVPGYTLAPGWNDALASGDAHGHDLVIAAGNDGVTQTSNVPWNYATNPTIIIVGSVGVDGTISNFSNRPGEACLLPTSATACVESNKLKYRFIVAPGELILVSDGQGGFTRQTGTSLAAPLVSGAITLLQNRWPWLSKYPDETAQIILKSATPLGAQPGADATYGVGELNIRASQSPLNWSSLQYYTIVNGKIQSAVPLSSAQMEVQSYMSGTWGAANVASAAFEPIGATYRDFEIPLSSKLVGQKVTTSAGGQLYQSYLMSALIAQGSHFAGVVGASGVGSFGFSQASTSFGKIGGMDFAFGAAPRVYGVGFRSGGNGRTVYATSGTLTSEHASFSFGTGEGAAALDGRAGFGFHSDYDIGQGGANPLLGLASGGEYLSARYAVVPGLTTSLGITQRNDLRDFGALGLPTGQATAGIRRYAAQAERFGVDYKVNETLMLHGSVTTLHEASAALGVQSLDPADLRGGSDTAGITLGFDLDFSDNLMLTVSGTTGSTRMNQGQLRTAGFGLISTAGEIALTKTRLLTSNDSLRLAIAKPLHVDAGRIRYDTVQVVDRQTGELGIVTQGFSPVAGGTPISAELLYGRSLAQGRGEFSLFGRVDSDPTLTVKPVSLTGGVQARIGL